jgi:hypothetical protein
MADAPMRPKPNPAPITAKLAPSVAPNFPKPAPAAACNNIVDNNIILFVFNVYKYFSFQILT